MSSTVTFSFESSKPVRANKIASASSSETFKLYSLDTSLYYSAVQPIKRNFVPCGAIGLQDASNVFLLDKDRNDRVIISYSDYLNFKLNNKVGKEFTL